jgi:putative heme iron utilization protein
MADPSLRAPQPDLDFDPEAQSKQLLRVIRSGALATPTKLGSLFATLAAVATLHDGSPVLLLSRLAVHTRNLERSPRCSLLLSQGGKGDPLAPPRLTLEAVAARTGEKIARDRFLRRNPKSELYADFPDFSFWQLEV